MSVCIESVYATPNVVHIVGLGVENSGATYRFVIQQAVNAIGMGDVCVGVEVLVYLGNAICPSQRPHGCALLSSIIHICIALHLCE